MFLGLTVTVSCSMTRPLDSDLTDDEVTADRETLAVYEALCRYWERCAPEKLGYFAGDDVAACVDYYECLAIPPEASPRPRHVWLPEIADGEACREHIASSSCDSDLSAVTPYVANVGLDTRSWVMAEPLDQVAACAADGPRAGEACLTAPAECAGDLYCSAREPHRMAGDRFCGTCQERAPVGALCDEVTACEIGAYCNGVCTASRPAGAPCDSPEHCVTGICLDNTCREPGEVGVACDSALHCQSKVCLGGICAGDLGSAGIYASDLDAPCEDIFDCRLGLVCVDGTCRRAACVAERGAPCEHLYPRGCESGSVCVSEGVCIERYAEGEACSPQWSCEPGLQCISEGSDGWHCRRLLPDGSPCGEHQYCLSGYCHRTEFDDVCYLEAPWWTQCDVPPCDGCGVCAPKPTTAQCMDTL